MSTIINARDNHVETLHGIINQVPPHLLPNNIARMVCVCITPAGEVQHITYNVQPHEVSQVLQTLLFVGGSA